MSPAHIQRCASGQVAAGTHTLCNEPHAHEYAGACACGDKISRKFVLRFRTSCPAQLSKASKFGCKIGVSALEDDASA
jgi:hypothetical protein